MMEASKIIRLHPMREFPPLIYRSINESKTEELVIDDFDGIIPEIMFAIRRNLNLTYQQAKSEQNHWDLKVFPHAFTYNRMQDSKFSTEIYYTRVTMFSRLSKTQRGSFLSNIITIPLWFYALVFLAILVLSALTKASEKSNKFGSFMWMYFAPLFQKSFEVKIVHRVSAHLLNIWYAALIVLNIVVLCDITADVLVGQKNMLNHLSDILRFKNVKYVTGISTALEEFFDELPGDFGKQIRQRNSHSVLDDIDDFVKVVKGELVYIDFHEEVDELNEFCKIEMKNKSHTERPLLYRSPFPLRIDSVGFYVSRNHTMDKVTLQRINRILRYAASSCLCDQAIKKAFAWLNTKCVTAGNHIDDGDYADKESEVRMLLSILSISLMPACLIVTCEICFKLCPCFETASVRNTTRRAKKLQIIN